MRKTVLVPVEKRLCDAHIARDGSEMDATDTLELGRHTWDLCLEHSVIFGRYLCDAMGVPASAMGDPAQEPTPEAEPVSGAALEPEADDEPESESVSDAEPVRSVMISGEIPGYGWDDAREAVRNLGYQVVGRADETTVLIICGEGAERNATKLRDARERDLPCFDATKPGAFKAAVCAGQFSGGDLLPEPVKKDAPAVISERERNRLVRVWARANGYRVPDKGRIPMSVRYAYDLTHRDVTEGKAVAA
ncbi:Lsr2 family DNA-binding protein [Streptomyces sp. H39-C1]|uniref:Lsr2 family DNA-binding protein n=1 Tax=Streptomyces sp. H39-C1 TaxID=3004355 RepID=UPI0022AF9FCA|nr:histone-like nucleoid-structuring protein Lsr2 [Streptomyces sp. H39-C1]MCZ4101707.1 Lsr2 family protein [Streptomyces sp. H39-C1]